MLRPRKRLRLDRTLEDNTSRPSFNNSAECNLTGGIYSNAAPGHGFSQLVPAAESTTARTENVHLQTWSYDTNYTMASQTYVTQSTTPVQSTLSKNVVPTPTSDVSQFEASATSGYDLVSSKVRPREEVCFGAVRTLFVFLQYGKL